MALYHHKPTLTYFGSRGLAENIRVLLAEAKVDYEEISLGSFNREAPPQSFTDLVASGVLPFNLVPIWQEPNGIKLTQSNAILRHIARHYHFYGKNEAEAARADELAEGMQDLRVAVRTAALGPDKEAAKKQVVDVILPKWLTFYEKILGSNEGGKGFFVGSDATYADFIIWHFLETTHDQQLFSFDHYPLLHGFKHRIEARPAIVAHRNNPKRYPIQLFFS